MMMPITLDARRSSCCHNPTDLQQTTINSFSCLTVWRAFSRYIKIVVAVLTLTTCVAADSENVDRIQPNGGDSPPAHHLLTDAIMRHLSMIKCMSSQHLAAFRCAKYCQKRSACADVSVISTTALIEEVRSPTPPLKTSPEIS